MSITEITGLLTIMTAVCAPYITESVKARFGRKAQAADEAHRTHDEIRADLAAERTENARLVAELNAAKAREDGWRDKCRDLEKANLELLRQNITLDTDLKAILKGGLTKS